MKWISGDFDIVRICPFCYDNGMKNAVAMYKSGIYTCTRCKRDTKTPLIYEINNKEGWPNGKAPVLKTEFGETCGGSNPSPSASF